MNNLFRTEPAPPGEFRRTGFIFLASALLHALVIAAALLAQIYGPDPVEEPGVLEMVFEPSLPPPPPARPPLPAFRPPPPARPPAPAPPGAPAVPPPPSVSRDVPLLGWNSKTGQEEGRALRPPGEEGKVHGPGNPPPGGGDGQPLTAENQDRAAAGNAGPSGEPGESADKPPQPGLRPIGDDLLNRRRPPGQAGGGGSGRPLPENRRPGSGPAGPGRGLNTGTSGYGSAFGDLVFDSRDYQWSDYSTKVYFAVYRSWLRELYGRVRRFERDQQMLGLENLDGQVSIRFVIHRDGSIQDLAVVAPGVVPTLDEASAAALRRAVLPPLPDDFPRDREGVTFRFIIRGFESGGQLEQQLREMQWAGEF